MKKANVVIISQNEFGVEPNITKLFLSTNDFCFNDDGGSNYESFEEYVLEQTANVTSLYNQNIVISEEDFDNIYEIEAEETEVEY
jgi:hypothetical protein